MDLSSATSRYSGSLSPGFAAPAGQWPTNVPDIHNGPEKVADRSFSRSSLTKVSPLWSLTFDLIGGPKDASGL